MNLTRHLPAAVIALAWPTTLLAAPTQEEVFKSIQNNVDGRVDGTIFLYVLGGILATVIVVSLVNRKWQKAAPGKKSLNHQGKLMREVLKAIPLKGREVKQLKALAEITEGEKPLASPLTLLLCPSVLAKTIQSKKPRGDRKALINVARKAGLKVTVQ